MSKLLILLLFFCATLDSRVGAQETASQAKQKNASPTPAKKGNTAVQKAMGSNPANPTEPITTEIYADEASFDSNKSMGIFTGRVKVSDPRFNLQSEKLTVFISKGQNQSLEKAIAEGNVGLIRDRPG